MKVAIDCRMLDCSGIGVFLCGILPYLLEDDSHEFLLIGDNQKLKKYDKENVKIESCTIPIFSLKELFDFPVTAINSCNIFFTPNYNIPMGIKIPVYSVIHDVIFLDVPSLTSHLGYWIRRFYLKMAIKRSKHLFTVSEFSKRRIRHHFNPSIPISICSNGVSLNLLNATVEKLPETITTPYYLFVGNIKPHKGLSTLLSAAQDVDGYQFVIVGNKDNFKTPDTELSSLIEAQSENGKIVFTGKVSDGLLKNLYKNAVALIQPSIYEGFGIPPLEAMALGTPAVVSDIEVFREIYADYPVKYFKTGDAESLKKHLNGNHECIQLSRDLLERYSYKNSAKVISDTIIS